MDPILTLQQEVLSQIEKSQQISDIEQIRVSFFGKKGALTNFMKELGSLSPDEKREKGSLLNQVKEDVLARLEAKKEIFETAELAKKLEQEKLDLTLPVAPEQSGSIHPISQTIDELIQIFGDMGFVMAEGPEIETDFNNFTALNIAEHHPARQSHDTFYMPKPEGQDHELVLRTHTSPVQVRTMLTQKPPIRIIAPGRTYRSDYDMTHTPMFHQIEGLYIDKKVTMADLKGCLQDFCDRFFKVDHLPLRFRASFFPFTSPSAEVDIGCSRKDGKLTIGAGDDWLEILGCGMVHPKVLENCGIDPDEYQGFAFGMGVERIAMLKYGIPDLRTFFESDYRWMSHYGFSSLNIPNLLTGL